MKKTMKPLVAIGALAFVALDTPAWASEGGGSNYPHGAEQIMTAVLPPPGTYLLSYANYYTADRLNDGDGNRIPINFKLNAEASINRIVTVTNLKILGATYANQIVLSAIRVDVSAGGRHDERTSFADTIVTPVALEWKLKNLHIVAATDFFLPTGAYNKNRLANIGRNYVSIEPVLAFSYNSPSSLELSAKFMYDFNTKNNATDYKSGQELHVDFFAGITKPKSSIGVSGYYVKQTTDDRQNGLRVANDGNRGEAVAIGPSARINIGKVPLFFTYQKELRTENRPDGSKLWLRAIVLLGHPFGK